MEGAAVEAAVGATVEDSEEAAGAAAGGEDSGAVAAAVGVAALKSGAVDSAAEGVDSVAGAEVRFLIVCTAKECDMKRDCNLMNCTQYDILYCPYF